MRNTVATIVAVVLTVGVVGPRAAKPDPTPNWRCRVTLRDASGDKIQSDGAGSYVDGLGGVTCYIVNEPGVAHDRWLFLSLPLSGKRGPERIFRYIGQTFEGASYPSFSSWGTFEVKGLAKVPWNPTGPSPRDGAPFPRRRITCPSRTPAGIATSIVPPDGSVNLRVEPLIASSRSIESV